jgi:hypothetical protein
VPAVQQALQAGGQRALGGQIISQAHNVILQAHDAQRRRQAVALAEQLPNTAREGQLTAGVTAVPAADRCGVTAPAASRARRNACCTPSASAARPVVYAG